MKKIVISAIMIAINMYAGAQTKDSVSYELNLGEVVVKSHVPKGKVIPGGISTRISGSDWRKAVVPDKYWNIFRVSRKRWMVHLRL